MFSHERFKELSALSIIGQLSSDEDRELEVHLTECVECREAQQDYSRILLHKLPAVIPRRSRADSRHPMAGLHIRDRFVARARTEGIELSSDAERAHRSGTFSLPATWRWQALVGLAALAAIAIGATWALLQHGMANPKSFSDLAVQQPRENENELSTQVTALRQKTQQESDELQRLRSANVASAKLVGNLEHDLEKDQIRIADLSEGLQSAISDNKTYVGTNEQKDRRIAELQNEIDVLSQQKTDELGDSVIKDVQIRQLTRSLEEKTAELDREHQLTAASNDVRQLMGARNLHIIDVNDIDGTSRFARAFGRVFYAANKSLIFYAFDLPNGGLTSAKYTFKAWGQRDAAPHTPRNLGTFEIDDHEQRRWVLKINDPALLAGIDSVFVTSESRVDAKEPHGKKLLYAYIVGPANHP